MKTHQEGPACWPCIERYQAVHELRRLRDNIVARRRRLARSKTIVTRAERMETYEMLDNTAHDLGWSIDRLVAEQAEHMSEATPAVAS